MTACQRSAEAAIRRTFTRTGRDASGRFGLEGTRLVERALRAEVPLETSVCSRAFAASEDPREQALRAALPDCVVLPDEVFRPLVGGRGTGDILAVAPLPTEALPPRAGTLLVADEILDPGNVGALVRTALAGGADGLLAIGITDPFHPRAVRTSMGSLFRLPIWRDESLAAARERFPDWRFLASGCRNGVALPEADLSTSAVAIVLGSEAFGLDDEVADALDGVLTIPMPDGVDSYSVNAAAAVLLYERVRQAPPVGNA